MSAIAWVGNREWEGELGGNDRELQAWEGAYGAEWVSGFRRLVDDAREKGIILEAGSADLLVSPVAWELGLSPLHVGSAQREWRRRIPGSLPRPGSWILRTTLGARTKVLEMIESTDGLAPFGRHPAIQVEESVAAGLPAPDDGADAWPGAEAWCRADLLVRGTPRAGKRALGDGAPPSSFGALIASLRNSPSPSPGTRSTRPREDVLVCAVDLLRAAAAWDRDRVSYWRARESLGFADGESRGRWIASARRWGIPPRDLHATASRAVGSAPRAADSRFSRPPGGGTVPFLPLTVIAHDPRHAASRSILGRMRKDRRS